VPNISQYAHFVFYINNLRCVMGKSASYSWTHIAVDMDVVL